MNRIVATTQQLNGLYNKDTRRLPIIPRVVLDQPTCSKLEGCGEDYVEEKLKIFREE